MNEIKRMLVIMAALVGLLALVASANAISPVDVVVHVENTQMDPGDTVDLERGEDFEVEVEVLANEDVHDLTFNVFITGYDGKYPDDVKGDYLLSSLRLNHSRTRSFSLSLPSDIDEADHKLGLMISSKEGILFVESYDIYISAPKHEVEITDTLFNPDASVEAGRIVEIDTYVENIGGQNERVKVTASIEKLSISTSSIIKKIQSGDEENTGDGDEDMYLRIPECTEPGVYTIKVTAEYNSGRDDTAELYDMIVTEGSDCKKSGSSSSSSNVGNEVPVQTEKTIITVGPESQDVVIGEGGSIYPVTVSNQGSTTKTYTLEVEGTEGWADVRITPSNVAVLKPGETQAIYVYVTALDSATVGNHLFAMTVKLGNEVVQQAALTAHIVDAGNDGKSSVNSGSSSSSITGNVVATDGAATEGWSKVKKGLEIGLVVLVVLLVILGLIIAFNKMKSDEEDEENLDGQTYY